MDILAARKKAAERALAAKTQTTRLEGAAAPAAAPEDAVVPLAGPEIEKQNAPAGHPDERGPERLPEPDAGFPPIPDTSFVPDEPISAKEQHPSVENEPAEPVKLQEPEQQVQEQELEMLSFLLGREEYAVPVEQVREVLTPKEITPVPHTADYFVGVCSLRGAVMPVIDLNRRLGLAASERDEKSRIIVVSLGQDDQVGLFVDRVRGVVRFLPSVVRPAPETVAQGSGAEFLKGIARTGDRLYILLDVEKAVGT
ncbi:MAG: chemotaxis protein CheW [Nitrospirota bacterium]